MGYQITFVPSEEKMNTYKPWNENNVNYEKTIKNYVRELISLCLKDNSDKMTYKIADSIDFNLRSLYGMVELDEKYNAYKRWKSDEDHELWYCGWQFSRDSELEKDDVIENTTDRLTVLADVVKTPDYFEDGSKFSQKWTEVSEEVEGFVELARELVIHDIINDLREFEKKYDEEGEVSVEDREKSYEWLASHPIPTTKEEIKEWIGDGANVVENKKEEND